MAVDDEGARKARADALRRQIGRLKDPPVPARNPASAPVDEVRPNYRDRIDKRMHELDDDKKK